MQIYGRVRGSPVKIVTLGSSDGLQAKVLTLGGTLVSLSLPVDGRRVPLILTLPDLDAYLRDRNYMGQLIGRYANRIANAAFDLDGRVFRLTPNDGEHALHGGIAPFGKELWQVVSAREGEEGFVRLAHLSSSGAGGFPGKLEVTATIRVSPNTIRLDFEAESDVPTPISFTWHPYFNLAGRADSPISTHQLRIAAASYLPVDSAWIPTGDIAPVAGSRFDYRSFREVGASLPADKFAPPLNHCFAIEKNRLVVAEVYCRESGIRMEVQSDQSGIQVYDGHYLREQHPGWHGLALEPGGFPNAPNRPNFPDCILRPGVNHRSFLSYTFHTSYMDCSSKQEVFDTR
jgi:aldose 1-epimerase